MIQNHPPNHDDHPDQEIRTTLRSIKLPAVDLDQLAEELHTEMHGTTPIQPKPYSWFPIFAKAAIVFMSVGIFYTFIQFTTTTQSVNGFHIASQTEERDPSWVWQWKLERGYRVTIPSGSTVELTLADESILKCRGGTTLSVAYGEFRTITIDDGWIEVHAAKNPDYLMQVITPLGKVHVTGTVFQVEVIR